MGDLIYSMFCSLDGYIEDTGGVFNWAEPDEEVHAFVNDLEAAIGTHLLGRRMYEAMLYWEGADPVRDASPVARRFAELWQASEKTVYSTSLEEPASQRTRIERDFDPEAVRGLKASAGTELSVAGAGLAAEALRAGLVDQLNLFLVPVVVGGGKPALPNGLRLDLDLREERKFAGGFVYVSYRVGAVPG